MKIIKITIIAFLAALGILIVALIYISTFQDQLNDQDLHGMNGIIARIIIPDTYLYRNEFERLVTEDGSIGIDSFPVKNSIGPILLWAIANSNWNLVAITNSIVIFLSLIYFSKLCMHFNVKLTTVKVVLLYTLVAPIAMYYSIGATKELPNLLGFLGFFYYYIKNHYKRCFIFICLLSLFRYQLIIVIISFIIIDRLTKNPLRLTIIIMLLISSIYPVISLLEIFAHQDTELFRAEQKGGFGEKIELLRDNILILSALAILIRIFQTTFEPILTVISSGTLLEIDGFSVYSFFNLMHNLIIAPCWVIIFYKLRFYDKFKNRDTNRMLSLIILFIVPVGGFSFISYRYLFPISFLIIIAALKLKSTTPKVSN